MSSKFIITFKTGKKEEVECDDYLIQGAFVSFRTKGFNVLSLKDEYVDSVAFKGDKLNHNDLHKLRDEFSKKYKPK